MAAKPLAAAAKPASGEQTLSPGLTARLLTDGPVRWTLAVAAAVACFYLQPWPPHVEQLFTARVLPLLSQGLILFALRRDLGRLDEPTERRFWGDLTAAHGCWLVASLLLLLHPAPRSQVENLTIDSLYCIYYLALILAIERRVHRLHPWRPTGFERALVWPGAVLFVLGLMTYCILVPGVRQALYLDDMPSYVLYLSLDLYVAGTFLYLARTSATPRWRALYLGLGIAYGTVLVADLVEALLYFRRQTNSWSSPFDFLWFVPYILVVLAVRGRHLRFSPVNAESVVRARAEQDLSGPSGRTMGTALAIPFLHFLCFRLGLLEEHRDLRELVVVVWILLLGLVAAVQHKMLRSRLQELQDEREEFESSLSDGEKDLRLLVERFHSQQQIRETEQKFTKAFHANPDAMTLSTRHEGKVLEANATFLNVSGFAPEEVLDKSSIDLGMWQTTENRQRMLQRLEQTGRICDQETLVPWPTGGKRAVSVSVEPLDIDGEPCLLTVFQALSRHNNAHQAELFDHSEAAIAKLDGEGRIVYWNESAGDLYGWLGKEVLGRPADQCWLKEPANTLSEVRSHLTRNGAWRGDMTHRTRDGQMLPVEAWWSRVGPSQESSEDLAARPSGILFFGFPTFES